MGTKVSETHNLRVEYPRIAAEWHPSLNGEIKPEDVTSGCNIKYWWQCATNADHIWEASPNKRTQGRGCPYCAHRKVSTELSLAFLSPDIAQDWDYEDNTKTPSDYLNFSNAKVSWKCKECGYKWIAAISNRTNLQSGCPICSNLHIEKGYNDLETLNPILASEWNYELNSITPDQVGVGTNKKVWWKCQYGHVWKAAINNRNKGVGCPECQKYKRVSVAEQIVHFYIAKYYPDSINSYHADWLGRKEIDIFIPSCRVGIEYDGAHWHLNPNNDKEKDILCDNNDITLIRIREPDCLEISRNMPTIVLDDLSNISLERAINKVLEVLGCKEYQVSITNDYKELLATIRRNAVENNLAVVYPEIAAQLNPELNGGINPYNIPATGSKEKYVWKCGKCGYEWSASLDGRIHGHGCPCCAGRAVQPGYNDLESQFPQIAAEWADDLNNGLRPSEVTTGSKKQIWWRCKEQHEWQETVNLRVRGYNCPYCSGKRALKGFNDLSTVNPYLSSEWDFEKNSISPDSTTEGSSYKAHWICSVCGYNWEAPVYSRTAGCGCPKCAKKKQVSRSRKTHEQFVEDVRRVNPNIEIIGRYISKNIPVTLRCLVCGSVWTDYSSNILFNKRGCKTCRDSR